VTYTGEGIPPNPVASGGEQLQVDTGGPGCNWVVAGSASPANSSVTAAPTSVPADGSTASTITVVVKDVHGTALPGDAVTLTGSGAGSKISPSGSKATDSSGSAVFTVTDANAESVTYTAKDASGAIGSAAVAFTTVGPSSGASSLAASPSSVPANGTSASVITVTLRSSGGSAVAGDTIVLVPSTGSKAVMTPATAVTGSNGAASFNVTDKTIQTVTFTATDTTAHLGLGSVQVTFTKPTKTRAA
jgi:hypothetical protein